METLSIERRMRRMLRLGAAVAALCCVSAADAADSQAWIASWAASPQPIWGMDFFAPVGVPRALRDQTVRQVARLSLGGHKVRIEISNEYGNVPLHIGAAQVASASEGATIHGTPIRVSSRWHSSLCSRDTRMVRLENFLVFFGGVDR